MDVRPSPARPTTSEDVAEAIADASRSGRRLSIVGGRTKASVGAPVDPVALDMGAFSGVVDYDPAELVLTVGGATPLREIEALVAAHRQMLAFEPYEFAPIAGGTGASTIGGAIASGTAGSQRVSHGSARDHLLGFRAVSGRGEPFVAGAKVVKNVTGYDLPKLAAGSWGRLFALTEVTLKVLPAPRVRLTKIVEGLDFPAAQRAMAAAMGAPCEVAAAAHLPAATDGTPSRTAIRIQGFRPSVAARSIALADILSAFGPVRDADEAEAATTWSDLRTLAPLAGSAPLWRISVPPSRAPRFLASLRYARARWLADWAGGLIWLASGQDPQTIRAAVTAAQGHATLIRGPADLRAAIHALHPQPARIAALEARVRRAFDPQGVFETGRFGKD